MVEIHINEIVFSKSCLDVGICIGADNSGVPIIHARYCPYSDSIYGGVHNIDWLASGVYCTKKEWDRKTNDRMSASDVMNLFGINKNCLIKTPCFVEEEGSDVMTALTTFLSDCEYVKQGKAAKLAKQIMSRFRVLE